MHKVITKWITFCSNKKWLFFILLCAITGLSALFLFQNFKTSAALEENLPASDLTSNFKILLDVNQPDEQVFFKIQGEQLQEKTKTIDSVLRSCVSLDTLYFKVTDENFDPQAYVKNNAPLLLNTYDYKHIEHFLDTASADSILSQNHAALFRITSSFGAQNLFDDPFHILPGLYRKMGDQNTGDWVFQEGYLYYPDSSSLFARGHFNENMTVEQRIAAIDNTFQLNQPVLDRLGVTITYFSPAEIHIANAQQIEKDTKYTIWIAVGIIVFLLFFFYRSLWTPVFFLIPTFFAGLGGLTFYFLFRDNISLLALGSSSVIIGIVLDYSFHFFTHFRSSKDIFTTIKDVAYPMTIGSFTTCIALFGLLFTDAPVLQQFGLMSGLVLICALTSVLFILPVIVNLSSWFNFHKRKNIEIGSWHTPKVIKWAVGLCILGVTLFSLWNVNKVSFNGDLSALSFHPEELKQKENQILNKSVTDDQQLFLIHTGKTKEEALVAAEHFKAKIESDSITSKIKQSNYISDYFSSSIRQKEKIKQWRSFWGQHKNFIHHALQSSVSKYDYQDAAYDGFYAWSAYDSSQFEIQQLSPQFPHHTRFEGEEVFVSSVVTDKKDIQVIQALADEHTAVFNRTAVSNRLTETINDNFNFIALLTSCIVFFTLLIIYGRIELTLITFLPMALSWIWILGICGYFNIQFNLVNIIIASFIFGLGDDFAVFLTDAAIERHKYGKDKSRSFKTGILLSGITTIVGTGVLIFAQHPALHSIGVVSIIGMSSILFLSLTLQPVLYKILIFKRKEKGLPPWTLKSMAVTVFSFTYFFIGCVVINLILLILKGLIFIPRDKRKLMLHRLIQLYSKSLVYIMVNNKKKILDRFHLNFDQPSIIIANHQSFTDLLLLIMLHPKLILLTNKWVYHSPFFGIFIRFLDYLPKDIPLEELTPKLKALTSKGYSIVIFPEGTRSTSNKIGRFHKGAFYFAEKLQLPITPIVLHGFGYAVRKGDFMLKDASLTLKILPTIRHDDHSWGQTYQDRTKSISRYFKKEYAKIQSDFALNKRMYYKNVVSNFIYKSNVIEWYIRIKAKFQMDIFYHIHQNITGRKSILDLGSGLGYSNMFLAQLHPQCNFEGWDYDSEKVAIAQNSFFKLPFKNHSIAHTPIPQKDIYILCDVLHYLSEEEQFGILKQLAQQLPEQGTIFIRDGFSDDAKHQNTQKTEYYSTELFAFNKTTQPLCFITLEAIQQFAAKHQLILEILHEDAKNSNTLLKLTRHGEKV